MIRKVLIIGADSINPANDNADVHVELSDGRIYAFLVATPSNLSALMLKEGTDHFVTFPPPVIVHRIDETCIRNAMEELFAETSAASLARYGVLQQ